MLKYLKCFYAAMHFKILLLCMIGDVWCSFFALHKCRYLVLTLKCVILMKQIQYIASVGCCYAWINLSSESFLSDAYDDYDVGFWWILKCSAIA